MIENKKLIRACLSIFLMSSLALEAKNLPFYNSGFEVWERYLLTNFDRYTDMPSGWDLITNSYPVDLRKEDNYHINPFPPRQGKYALYFFDTSFNRPVKTKGYTLSEGTYTYSVYASTMDGQIHILHLLLRATLQHPRKWRLMVLGPNTQYHLL